MRGKRHREKLLCNAGAYCPLCGTRVIRSTYFCARCGRSERLHVGPEEVRGKTRTPFMPRRLAH